MRGLIALMETPDEVIGPINLGNPGEFSILQLAEEVIALTGSRSMITRRPLPQDDPKQGGQTSAWPRPGWAGHRKSASTKGSRAPSHTSSSWSAPKPRDRSDAGGRHAAPPNPGRNRTRVETITRRAHFRALSGRLRSPQLAGAGEPRQRAQPTG